MGRVVRARQRAAWRVATIAGLSLTACLAGCTTSLPVPTTLPGSPSGPPTTSSPPTATPVTWGPATGTAGDFWLVGTYTCSKQWVCLDIVRSVDGEATFQRVGAPGVRSQQRLSSGVGSFVFANAHDKYVTLSEYSTVSGFDRLYWSADGGESWGLVPLSGQLASPVVATGGRVYILVTPCPASRQYACHTLALASARVGSDPWHTLAVPAVQGFSETTMAAFGSTVWLGFVHNGGGSLEVMKSNDDGRHFSAPRVIPLVQGLSCQLSATSASTLWGYCVTGMEGYGIRSADGGRAFTNFLRASNSTSFLPFSNSVAVYDIPLIGGFLTTDGGLHFTRLLLSTHTGFVIASASPTRWLAVGTCHPRRGP